MLSFECIKNEKSVYFLLTSANGMKSWEACAALWGWLPKIQSAGC